MTVHANLGARIRRLRRTQRRTLESVAGAAGFTRSLLSKIETGRCAPPVATLARLAAALGVSTADLLAEGHSGDAVLVRSGARTMTTTGKGYDFHAFAAARGDKLMQPFLFTARRGEIKPGGLSHRGEEFVYVLSGRMKYRVGGVEYSLAAGDALYFDAVDDHDLEPLTAEVKYLAVFVEGPAESGGC
jgi:transcriptional regulator with XRE-family HTH domain